MTRTEQAELQELGMTPERLAENQAKVAAILHGDKPQVQGNLRLLTERGARLVGPVGGNLACGESGIGAMASPDTIAGAVG